MASNRELPGLIIQGQEDILEYAVPLQGTMVTLPAHALPVGAIPAGGNIYIHKGELRTRPGVGVAVSPTLLEGAVLGGGIFSTAAESIPVAISSSRVYALQGAEWIDLGVHISSTSPIPSGSLNIRRIVDADAEDVFIFSTGQTMYASNGIGDLGAVAISFGSLPDILDFEVFFDRVIAIEKPYSIRWCRGNDLTQWPLTSDVRRTDGGELVAIQKLSSRTVAIYSQRGITVGFAQAGPESATFVFDDFRGKYEQPAGIHAIVDVDGVHFYLTPTGRVGIFDGSRQQWIADGVWDEIKDDIDSTLAHQTFAFYDNFLHLVGFVYPQKGSMTGLLLINLPKARAGTPSFASFLGQLAVPLSYGFAYLPRFDSSRVFVFDSDDKRTYQFTQESNTDVGKEFNSFFQTRLIGVKNAGINRLYGESYFERMDGYGSVNMRAVTSNTLGSFMGTLGEFIQIIDLNKEPVAEQLSFVETGKFLGLRYDWGSTNTVRWKGALFVTRRNG